MKRGTFIYEGRLPSLNDVVKSNRTSRYAGASLKKTVENEICWAIRRAMSMGKIEPVKRPCAVWITFQEKTKRRDIDNIQSGTKFVLDALQKMKILPNDNLKWVTDIKHSVIYGDEDRVYVSLYEGAKFVISVTEQ